MKICNCVLINENKWLLWTNTSGKSASLIDMTVSMSLLFFSFIVFFISQFISHAHAIFFPCLCMCACRDETRLSAALSQIAPMRDPKITTKGPQWVGWKPCHQPFQHNESPPLLYHWVTPHTSHGDSKGRQSHIFDRNKYFSVLTGLFWPPPPPPLPPYALIFCVPWWGGGSEGLLIAVWAVMWSRIHGCVRIKKFGVDEQSWT